jgi:SAM-dependent methyltransferase
VERRFDRAYWDEHWSAAPVMRGTKAANPYVRTETASLPIGTALDAGCGAGTESLWLAGRGWRVTGVDISFAALEAARQREGESPADLPVEWLEADLAHWEPDRSWDLVVTSYAHADIGQLALYRRLSSWVAPGGTLLIVAHRSADHPDAPGSSPHPASATASLADITAIFEDAGWRTDAAYENNRAINARGHAAALHDVVVRVHRTR